jgi:hypothetical protein
MSIPFRVQSVLKSVLEIEIGIAIAEIEYLQIGVTKYMYVYFSVIKTINSNALFSKLIEYF